jgi:signal transduction histidine kinase
LSNQLIDTLENLIRNGVEAIGGSGSVTIDGRTEVTDAQEWVAIDIEDTGRGIPPDHLSKIFDPFFTTKSSGMGIGLWKAKALIQRLGGEITVQSEVGKGTTFTIRLPVTRDL